MIVAGDVALGCLRHAHDAISVPGGHELLRLAPSAEQLAVNFVSAYASRTEVRSADPIIGA